jgi:membrane protein DedA with SNARE-associated domain
VVIPLAIIEGPIISIICGFLTTMDVFNPLLIFVVMVFGDIVGDGIFYSIGLLGKRFLPFFKITEEKIEKARKYFNENHNKAIIASKVVYGLGTTGLIAAGVLHVPYRKYFKTCAIISLIQSTIMITVGIFFGGAYEIIGKYFDYYAAIGSVAALFIIFFIAIRKYKKSVSKKINL